MRNDRPTVLIGLRLTGSGYVSGDDGGAPLERQVQALWPG
jgi:hypothetical protein